ncbi:MAG: YMGG-like glycine zipper-containing protein [Syntrophales bacterium]
MQMLNEVMLNRKIIAIKHTTGQRLSGTGLLLLLLLMIFGITSCYYQAPPVRLSKRAMEVPVKAPAFQIYFYPKMGQSPDQQDRDRYECYNWGMKQTGFDPGSPSIPPERRVTVVPVPPPGHDTAVGAITGAVIGALVTGPSHAGEGALIGAAAGALAGAVSDTTRQAQAKELGDAYARQDQESYAQLDGKALEFRRAMAACLEGRGYSAR